MRPRVNIALSNGNLGLTGPSENGTSIVMIASPAAPVGGYGVVKLIKNIAQAKAAFGQTGNEDVVTALVDGFFAEAAEGTKVFVVAMARTTTLQALVAAGNAEKALGGSALIAAAAPTCTITIANIGTDGNVLPLKIGTTVIGSYTKVSGDTTLTAVATAAKNAINAGVIGTATSVGAVITFTYGTPGASLNGTSVNTTGSTGTIAITSTPFTGGVDQHTVTGAAGAARLMAAIKFPSSDYVPAITDGFDVDVHNAVADAQTLADAWFAKKQPFRFFIQGFGFTNASDAKDYSTEAKRNGHIIVGSINDSTALATMLALGRASKSAPQQNIGRIKSGSLAIAETAILKAAAVSIDEVPDADLEDLYDKRYITFEKNAIASGYVFNDDNSLTSPEDDYNNLRYGRVIDNATRVAFETYYLELKEDVEVDENGRLATVVEKALENAIETAIDTAMRPQLSKGKDGTADVQCLVNPDPIAFAPLYETNEITAPDFNILETGQVYLFLQLRPKGCLKYLNVYLGFTS